VAEPQVSDRILTIPNIVSFVRLAAVGLFWWVLLGMDSPGWAAVLIFLIGWTDWIDGYLARRLDQVTRLGQVLDPVADRLMIGSAIIGGLIAGVIPGLIAWPLIARELLVGIVALVLYLRGGGVLAVRRVGKQATFVLYGAIPTFYFAAAGILEVIAEPLAWFTGTFGLVLYWYAAILYVGDATLVIRELESATSTQEP
jgi:cardiolipin synthase